MNAEIGTEAAKGNNKFSLQKHFSRGSGEGAGSEDTAMKLPFMYVQIFPEKELSGLSPNHIHVSVKIYIFSRSVCLFCCRKICCRPVLEIYKSLIET
jgi:hypothetical protein